MVVICAFYLFFCGNRWSHPLCLSCMLAVQINVPQSIFTWIVGMVEITSVMSWMPAAICHWSQWRKPFKNYLVASLWTNLPSVFTAEVWNAYASWFLFFDYPNVFAALILISGPCNNWYWCLF